MNLQVLPFLNEVSRKTRTKVNFVPRAREVGHKRLYLRIFKSIIKESRYHIMESCISRVNKGWYIKSE